MVRCEAKDGKPFVTGALISCNSSTVQAHIVAVVHLYERNEQHEISLTKPADCIIQFDGLQRMA